MLWILKRLYRSEVIIKNVNPDLTGSWLCMVLWYCIFEKLSVTEEKTLSRKFEFYYFSAYFRTSMFYLVQISGCFVAWASFWEIRLPVSKPNLKRNETVRRSKNAGISARGIFGMLMVLSFKIVCMKESTINSLIYMDLMIVFAYVFDMLLN